MIPSFSVPSGVSLPDAMPIPNIPYRLPSFDMPRWTPIVPPLPEQQMMTEPRVPPPQEEIIKEKPKPKPKPQPKPEQPPPSKPLPEKEEPLVPVIPEVTVEETIVIEIPFIGELPIPPAELLVTAGTTAAIAASVSVVAALSATTLINYLMKAFAPALKFVMKRLLKRNNKYTVSWARQRQLERLQHRRK